MKKALGTSLEDLLRQRNETVVCGNGIQSREDQAQACFAKGVELMKTARYFDALPPLFAALEFMPGLTKAANNLSLVLWQLECPRLAMEMTRRVLARDPDNIKVKANLAFMEDRIE